MTTEHELPTRYDVFLNRLKLDFTLYHITSDYPRDATDRALLLDILDADSPERFAELIRDASHDYYSLTAFFGTASDDDPRFDAIFDDLPVFNDCDDPAAAMQNSFDEAYLEHTERTWTGPKLADFDT